jgi:hypothetical protein
MARVKYSPFINAISGSVGNATFQNSQGGSIVRNKPVCTTRNSEYQTAVRAAMLQAEYGWRALTLAQQTQYNNYTKYSPDYQKKNPKSLLSGYSLFVKYNTLRILQGLAILTDIVYSEIDYYPQITGMYWDTSYVYVQLNEVIDPNFWYFQLRASNGFTSANTRQLNDLRIIIPDYRSGEGIVLANGYTAVWGRNPQVGEHVRFVYTFFHIQQPFVYSSVDVETVIAEP